MKPQINIMLPNYDTDFDQYQGLFETIVFIARTIYKKGGAFIGDIKDQDIKVNYESTRKLLTYALRLICDGRSEEMVNLIMEIEYGKAIVKPETNEAEMQELLIAKVLIELLLARKHDCISEIIRFFCSFSIYSELVQYFNWLDPKGEINVNLKNY